MAQPERGSAGTAQGLLAPSTAERPAVHLDPDMVAATQHPAGIDPVLAASSAATPSS